MLSSRPGGEEGGVQASVRFVVAGGVGVIHGAARALRTKSVPSTAPGYLPDVIVYPSIELNLRHSHVILPNICPKKKPQRVRKNFM